MYQRKKLRVLTHSATLPDSPAQHRARRLNLLTLGLMLWALLVMLVLKLWVGWATHSGGILATSMHTLLCALSTLIALQSHRFPQPARQAVPVHGRLEVATSFLFWALLGFGGPSIVGMVFGQGWQGGAIATVSLALIQLMGLMGLVSFCFAFVERYMAGVTRSSSLSGNASLVLQEAWLNLLMLCCLLLVRYGYGRVDGFLVPCVLLFVVLNAWNCFGRQLPQWFRPQAIAPEAIAQIVHRTEGVLRCVPLGSRGLVGRQVYIELQVLLHPEFEAFSSTVRRQIELALGDRYGAVEVTLELLNTAGKPIPTQAPLRGDRQALDFLDWN